MSLDTLNSDILDVSPFAEQYSYATRQAVIAPTTATISPIQPSKGAISLASPRGTLLAKPSSSYRPPTPRYIPPTTYATQPAILVPKETTTPPVTMPTTPAPPAQTMPTTQPVQTPPSSSSLPSTNTAFPPSTREQEGQPDETGLGYGTMTGTEKKDFMKSFWFWGVIIGGTAAYFYAKNKNTNMLSSVLIGAGIGGAAGYGLEKFTKPVPVTTTNQKPTESQPVDENTTQQ